MHAVLLDYDTNGQGTKNSINESKCRACKQTEKAESNITSIGWRLERIRVSRGYEQVKTIAKTYIAPEAGRHHLHPLRPETFGLVPVASHRDRTYQLPQP